jgi:hypothetical protein
MTLRDAPATGAAEKLKLSQALFALDDSYRDCCQELSQSIMQIPAEDFGAKGLNDLELQNARNVKLKEIVQPREAACLHRIGPILGLDFPLDKDPKHWGE